MSDIYGVTDPEVLVDTVQSYLDELSDRCPQPYIFVTRCTVGELYDPSAYWLLYDPVSIPTQTDDPDSSL